MKRGRSIRKTLMLVTMATSCGAVLLASTIFMISDYRRSERALAMRLTVLAEVIGLNSGPALLFRDSESATEVLSALAVEEQLIAAVLFTLDQQVFASYVRMDELSFAVPHEVAPGADRESGHFDLVQQISVDGEVLGYIFLRSDTSVLATRLAESAGIGLLVMALATGVSWFGTQKLRALIATPLSSLADGSARMAEGDLSVRVESQQEDELGVVAWGFNRMAESLAGIVSRVRGNARSVTDMSQRLQEASDDMHAESGQQQLAVEESSASIERMSESIEAVSGSVEALSSTAAETSAAVIEMDSSIQGVGAHVDELSVTIDQVASSVVEMASAIGEIAHGADNLNDATASTSTSFQQLNRSVAEVEKSAQQSHALAQRSSEQANRGVDSVQQTVGGMKQIQTSFQGLEEIIDRLHGKSQSIGEVVKVIEGVVEQTNLLALNAAIISSHAGEHGRAFAVVAHEIKNLADRTAGSTRTIASLIEDVQREVSASVESVAQGGDRVQRGVSLSSEAVTILQTIGSSAQESIQMAADIAEVTGGQSQDIKRAEQAMVQVQTIAKQLKGGTHEQDNASTEITRGVERMRELGQEVRRSTEEQRRESQHIAQAAEIVAGRINDISGATKNQEEHAEQILHAVQVFRDVTQQSSRRSEDMKRTIQILYSRAEELQEEVGRFAL